MRTTIPTRQKDPETVKVSICYAGLGLLLRHFSARLLQTLSALQSQLHELEEENSISRRRVRELELELEDCKRDVVRERTRLIEREELRKSDVSLRVAGSSRVKGKNKAKDVSQFGRPELDDERLRARYKEAVDEKKGQLSCFFNFIFTKARRNVKPWKL